MHNEKDHTKGLILRCGLFFMDFSLLSTGRAKQKTTRYAGGDKKVIQYKHLSATIRLFKSLW